MSALLDSGVQAMGASEEGAAASSTASADNESPEGTGVASAVVASHYNALPDTGIRLRNDSRILHLRNFNNWLKSMLIAEFLERLQQEGCSSATVLDFCCGKGGDLRKWRIGGIREVLMTDIAEVSLQDCRERFNRMRDRRTGRPPFRAHFVPADLSEVSLSEHLPSEAPTRFDLTSCQFALHYSFRTEQGARRMLKNAVQMLRPGGYFIGTVPDASVIMHYLRRSDSNRFFNQVCSVSIEDAQAQPPLFGAQIQFHLEGVVDCPEFLCYFPLLKQMLEEQGMELVWNKSFPDAIQYFLDARGREARDLMVSMNALETVDAKLLEAKGEAESAEYGPAIAQLISEHTEAGKQQKVGTLSASEWQVVTMYQVFAFRRRNNDDQQQEKQKEMATEVVHDDQTSRRDW